ncbi:MAG: molybdopterin cofactor-binding domain-containing protein [Steroidobacteraceae bacterium]
MAAQSFVLPSKELVRGRPREALAGAPHRLSGSLGCGGQDHFYLEGQVAAAISQDDGGMLVHSSTQHPSRGPADHRARAGRDRQPGGRAVPAHGRRGSAARKPSRR